MIDQFTFFCLAQEDKQFLSEYVSPSTESSTFKQIPIQHLDRVKRLLRQLGYRARIVYRGPRARFSDHTPKSSARAFTVYPKG
jgi:hypothetical protein